MAEPTMRHDLVRPCPACPFRRESLATWLGPWDCEGLLQAIGQGDFACHLSLGEDAERALDEGRAQSCAGAALFLNHAMTLSRGAALGGAPEGAARRARGGARERAREPGRAPRPPHAGNARRAGEGDARTGGGAPVSARVRGDAARAQARALMDAARVPDTVASGSYGPWTIDRITAQGPEQRRRAGRARYTVLHRPTRATLHLPYGEIVMEDSDTELRRHLQIWMHAHGRVLVTGLGLGCVVRGLAAKDDVEHIDVVEIDRAIIEAVGPEFEADPRVHIVADDARTHPVGGRRWHFAWHDLWVEEGGDTPHLQMVHAEVLLRFRSACAAQGAWRLPKFAKKLCPTLATL